MKVLKKRIHLFPNVYYDWENAFFYNSNNEIIKDELSEREHKILKYFCQQYDTENKKYISNKMLYKVLCGVDFDPYLHQMDIVTKAMSKLRRKCVGDNYVSSLIESDNRGSFAINLEQSPFEIDSDSVDELNPIAEYIEKYHLPRFNISTLRYDAENTSFCGRENEMKRLHDFVEDTRPLLWWAVTGKGGSGKSRLAYELMKSLNNNELSTASKWKAVMVEWSGFYLHVKKHFDEIIEWNSKRNYLIIIDYVQSFEKEIAEFIQQLTRIKWSTSKVRILLLERAPQIQDKNKKKYEPLWFHTFKSGWKNIEWLYGTCYNKDFIHLLGVDENSACDIISSYVSAFNKIISNTECENIIDYVKKISPHGIIPLLLLCVTDTWLDSPTLYNRPERISSSTIWSQIIDKEKKDIYQEYSEVISNALMEIHTIACIIHKLELSPDIFNKIFSLKRFYRYHHYKDEIISKLYESKYVIKIDYSDNLIAIEPDIIGEYFVYDVFQDYSKHEYTELFDFLYKIFPNETIRFIWRYVTDFTFIASQHPGFDFLYSIMSDSMSEPLQKELNQPIIASSINEEDMTFVVQNPDGVDVEYEIIFTFDSEEYQKSYVIYTDNSMDENGSIKIYASVYGMGLTTYDEDLLSTGELVPIETEDELLPIETEAEWNMISKIVNTLQSTVEKEIEKQVGDDVFVNPKFYQQ